ncbi:hypothetical protein Tco_0553078 [Tanacetum coccineum]
MAMNNLYQPCRAILSMINQCLISKTSGYDRPRYAILHMLWGIITRTNVDNAELMWEEFIQAIQTFLANKANLGIATKKDKKIKPHVIPYCRLTWQKMITVLEILTEEGGKKKSTSKTDQPKKPATAKQPKQVSSKQSKPTPAKQPKPVKEKSTKPTPLQKDGKGKGKGIASDEQVVQSLLELLTPKKTSTTDQYIFQRWIPVTEEASTGPSATCLMRILVTEEVPTRPAAQLEDDTSTNIIRDTSSPTDAKTGAETDKTNSEGDTEILNIGEEQGEDVANKVDLEEKTDEVDEGQARSDPGKTPESRPPPERVLMEEDQDGLNPGQSHVALAGPNPKPMHEDFVTTVYPQVHESLKHTDEEHVHLENPLSLIRTMSTMKNVDNFNFVDQFFNDKPNEEEPDKANVETEVDSMVRVPIYQASSDSDLASRVSTLEQVCANFEKRHKLQDKTVQGLSSRVFTLELRDLPHKIDQTVNEAVKEVVQIALQAQLRERFRDLSEDNMKEILHDQMDEFLSEKDKSRKRHRDDQDPHPPPTKESEQIDDIQIPDVEHISDSEDTGVAHLPKIKTRPDWLNPFPKEDRPETPKLDWVIPPNDLPEPENNWANVFATSYKDPKENKLLQKTGDMGSFIKCKERRSALSISKLKAANYPDFGLEELVPSLSIKSEREYDVSAAFGISHWWFKHKEFYITRHSAPSNRCAVRSHMKILSVVSLKTYSRYGYSYLKEIVLRRADYNEYKILESNFKNLHPNDFEDMYMLHLQGKLNHLSGSDKVNLFNAVNLWIRNIVIRKRVKDLQLGIKSYQTKLNLTEPSWDATDFLFKEDYTIVSKPRAMIYRDRNNQKKIRQEIEVHKFSDDKLTRILEKLDHMVKDFKLFKYNPGMEKRIWSEDDRRRSKEFMEVIERRLKIRRIFRSLESFVSGRLRDVDYRLIQRTE